MQHPLCFREWLLEDQNSHIVNFGKEFQLDVPPGSAISFDFDGTLTKWNRNGPNWYEVPFIPVIHVLKEWSRRGHKCIITTHRTKELEGNPAFLGHGRDKMKILDLVEDDVLPVDESGGIIYTHMGDKGEVLIGLKQKGLNVIMHYDDEMKNLTSVARVGILGVKVDPGPAPPKYHVAGDGQTPVPAMAMAH